MSLETRILGIDYGRKRIGLAVSDPLGLIAQGLPTINNTSLPDTLQQFGKIIEEYHVYSMVIGLPMTMRGEVGVAGDSINKFARVLNENFDLPIRSWDERLTTVMAHRTAKEIGKSPSKNREKIDQLSAMFILQSYLDYLKKE